MRSAPAISATLCALFLFGTATLPASAQLKINAIFDNSIKNNANSAAIMSGVNAVISKYEAKFTNNVTVNILFQNVSDGLGYSDTYYDYVNYSDYVAALKAQSVKSADDLTAQAHLTNGASNPVNGNTQVALTTPNLRALGFNGSVPMDSTIGLNTSLMFLNRNSVDPNKYDLQAVVAHEIDEVLGTGSSLDGLSNYPATKPSDPINAMDLFRYDANGNRSLTTNVNAVSYFSLDGTTHLAQFNQDDRGDFGDWYSIGSHTPQVQDAFGSPGVVINPNVEYRALDVIGWNVAPVPEPTSGLGLAAFALLSGAGFAIRRRAR